MRIIYNFTDFLKNKLKKGDEVRIIESIHNINSPHIRRCGQIGKIIEIDRYDVYIQFDDSKIMCWDATKNSPGYEFYDEACEIMLELENEL